MRRPKMSSASLALARQKDRLSEEHPFKAALLIVPFLAVTVLTIFTSLETATKLYGVAQPLEHPSAPSADQDVWLSVAAKDERIVVTTVTGDMFSWPIGGPSSKDLDGLNTYLKTRAEDLVKASVLRGQIHDKQNSVGLAVDQRLTYHHVRPIIYALADAGFSKYGFETRIVR